MVCQLIIPVKTQVNHSICIQLFYENISAISVSRVHTKLFLEREQGLYFGYAVLRSKSAFI